MQDLYLTEEQALELQKSLKEGGLLQVTVQKVYRLVNLKDRQLLENEELLSWVQTQKKNSQISETWEIENNLIAELSDNDFTDELRYQLQSVISIVTEGRLSQQQAKELATLIIQL
jgi:Asp-tRNA(Asn)/Glu-tRNA(Gln) amidotransferase B subunit